MAESQVPFPYTPAEMAAIRASVSADRFATYLKEAKGNERYAVELYLYNARLAKAFLYPLHVTEVTLRNAIDDMLVALHGPDWPTNAGFRTILTPESLTSLDRARSRAREKQPNPPRGQVVATLTFDFWSNLFRHDYDRSLWQVNLPRVLTNAPKGTTRAGVQVLVRDINHLRNRIAHHEPLLHQPVRARHAEIVDLTGLISPVMSRWLKHFSTVAAVTRNKPGPNLVGQTVLSRCDPNFQPVRPEDTLRDVLAAYKADLPSLVCVDADGCPISLLSAADLLAYTASEAAAQGGIIDFNDHTVGSVLDAGTLKGRWVQLAGDAPLAELVDALKAPAVRGVVSVDTVAGRTVPRGVLLRAHRRY
ncbi:hypothetical protein PMNALOAF_2243 [Methylobacterium adhaesivum]|uniref:Abi family protein n=1 Tax=Methylobacterium adhaesivum TaxID=333297 RepID=A0ABT8BPA1_9HYPH|nr:Abi family protein [Methylobacterium adhaesivum]MDN3593048.1 Abi family protein [Methylobacterium adhaesivum]GJD30991.1 hypothetical protein PMNALOAF_2243 [Methylobacterium adhaesivum]